MTRPIALLFALATALLAGAAMAQSDTPPPAPKPAASAGRTVEGLTVVAPPAPPKTCGSRDKQCIALVVADLKRLYPEELKRFCLQRDMRTRRTEINNDWLLEDLHKDAPPTPTTFGVNSALKTACAPDKK